MVLPSVVEVPADGGSNEWLEAVTEIGIDESNFAVMAQKAVTLGGLPYAFKPLQKEDVENIFKMCL